MAQRQGLAGLMAKQDYYEILGVSNAAPRRTSSRRPIASWRCSTTPTAIRATRRPKRKFKEVNEAYDVLKDDQKRAAYDRFGHAAFENGGGGRRRGGGSTSLRRRRLRRHLRRDVRRLHGRPAAAAAARPAAAPTCATTSRSRSRKPSPASRRRSACRPRSPARPAAARRRGRRRGRSPARPASGTGKVRAQQGFFTIERTCPTCHGAGRVIKNPCKICGGAGPRAREEKNLSVNIPAGVEDGTRIRLAGEGEAGLRGAPPGDLYIFLGDRAAPDLPARRRQHLLPRADPDDDRPRSAARSRCRRIDGSRARVTVPAGTQSGHQFRLRGKGMSVLRARRAATCTSRWWSRRR